MKKIPLTRGQVAMVDDEFFVAASGFKWRAIKTRKGFYAVTTTPRSEGSKSIYLHRFVMGEPRGLDVDHINHDGLDCRKSNLRTCTRTQNIRHRKGPRKASVSGIRGVSWHKTRKTWAAQIRFEGHNITLGYFPTKELAGAAYSAANRKYFGEFGGNV